MSTSKPTAKAIAKLLESLSTDALTALLADHGAAAVQALGTACALTVAASEGGIHWLSEDESETVPDTQRAKFVDMLIDAGVDRDRTTPRYVPPLVALLGESEPWADKAVGRLLDAGANPNVITATPPLGFEARTPLGTAVARCASAATIQRLVALADDTSRADALIAAIASDADPTPWLALVSKVDCVGPIGASAVHAAALGPPKSLAAVLAKSPDPECPATATFAVPERGAVPPGGGVLPEIAVAPGVTPLALVEQALALVRQAKAKGGKRDRPFDVKLRDTRIAALEANYKALVAAGAKPKPAPDPAAASAQAHPTIAADLHRLAVHVGADVDAVSNGLAAVDGASMGPWQYLVEVLEHVAPALVTKSGREALRRSAFLWILIDGDGSGFETVEHVRVNDFPKAARKAFAEGTVLGMIDATAFILWPKTPGVPRPTRVCYAHPEHFTIIGESVEQFVTNEVTAILSA